MTNSFTSQEKGTRPYYERKYYLARINLLVMIIFTVASAITSGLFNYYFFFSAYFPLSLFNTGIDTSSLEGLTGVDRQVDIIVMGVFVFLAVLIMVFYLVCWLASKKHPAWMIVALVLFSLDSIILLLNLVGNADYSALIDLAFHAWIMYYLISGVLANAKLKKLPKEEEITGVPAEEPMQV